MHPSLKPSFRWIEKNGDYFFYSKKVEEKDFIIHTTVWLEAQVIISGSY